MNPKGNIAAQVLVDQGLVDRYQMIYGKIRNENELTNQRLTWNFAIQGFLFFTWAYCIQAIGALKVALANPSLTADSSTKLQSSIGDIQRAALYIGRTGLVISILVFLGALAAQLAITRLEHYWHKNHKDFRRNHPLHRGYIAKDGRKWNTDGDDLPGLLGGGSPALHYLGAIAPLLAPLIFVVAWCYLNRLVPPYIP